MCGVPKVSIIVMAGGGATTIQAITRAEAAAAAERGAT